MATAAGDGATNERPPGPLSAFVQMYGRFDGMPVVRCTSGDLQIYPVGIDGPCLYMSPEHWRALNAAVEAVIANPPAAKAVPA
jgi:hypothetical protein